MNPRSVPLAFRRARTLRHEQTDTERVLWGRLRARRLNGLRFRRQFPISPFITDFCCRECRLVIELDGGHHATAEAIARDRRRTRLIEERGYRVIRFWDNEVLTNIEGVIEAILDATGRGDFEGDLSLTLSLDKEREPKEGTRRRD